MMIILSVGKYGGFYAAKWRICLGWVAFSFIQRDDDLLGELITIAEKQAELMEYLDRNGPCYIESQGGTLKLAPAEVVK